MFQPATHTEVHVHTPPAHAAPDTTKFMSAPNPWAPSHLVWWGLPRHAENYTSNLLMARLSHVVGCVLEDFNFPIPGTVSGKIQPQSFEFSFEVLTEAPSEEWEADTWSSHAAVTLRVDNLGSGDYHMILVTLSDEDGTVMQQNHIDSLEALRLTTHHFVSGAKKGHWDM